MTTADRRGRHSTHCRKCGGTLTKRADNRAHCRPCTAAEQQHRRDRKSANERAGREALGLPSRPDKKNGPAYERALEEARRQWAKRQQRKRRPSKPDEGQERKEGEELTPLNGDTPPFPTFPRRRSLRAFLRTTHG